jgi:hypothetical protein
LEAIGSFPYIANSLLWELAIKALDDADIQVLKQAENNDEKKHVDDAARAWELFEKQAKEGDERSTAKLALVYKLRELMKDYGTDNPVESVRKLRLT